MSILGAIVRGRPEHESALRQALAALPGLQIGASDGSRFVVVIEDHPSQSAAETLAQVALLPQVINTALVYENSQPDSPD